MAASRRSRTGTDAMPARFVIPTPGECERDRDCPEFSSHEEAQSFFESRGGPEQDPHRLDGNDDGEACEDFDFGGDKTRGGVETGFGGMAPRPERNPEPSLSLSPLRLVARYW
jgi:hypothetical protein